MEEKNTQVQENVATAAVKRSKLSPESTILLTVAFTLVTIVVGRVCYWIVTGN